MPQIDHGSLRSALTSKGFIEKKRTRRHERYYFQIDGKKISGISVSLSRSGKGESIPQFVLANVAANMRITIQELSEFVECTLTKEAYAAKVEITKP